MIIDGVEFSDEQAMAFAKKCHDDPVFFAKYVLGVEPWSKQAEFLYAVANNDRVALKSGHKVSKSHSMAILALWWASTREDARVPMTSASFHQVQKILWREIKDMYYKANKRKMGLGGTIYRDPASGLQFENGNEIFGFSTDQPERAAGISAANILYIVDEASGIVDEGVFEAMEGNMAAGAKMVMTSNPTRVVGKFYNLFHSERRYWKLMSLSAADSPNVTGETEIPGLATKAWVDEKFDEWGPDDPRYHVRVLGKFPGQAENSVIALGLVEDRLAAYETADTNGALRIGIDVARFGDDETVMYPVRGIKPLEPFVVYGQKGYEVAGHALNLVDKLRRGDEDVTIKIDVIGLGASPSDFLDVMDRARSSGITTREVNVAEKAGDSDKYHDLRTEITFGLRDWLMDGGTLFEDEKLKEELISPTYTFDAKGRMVVSPKKEEKKILGRSPDRRDALALAIYEATPRRTQGGTNIYM